MLIDGFPAVTLAADQFEIGKDLSGLIVRDSTGKARQGVFYRGTQNLLVARTDMAVDVLEFEGVAERRGSVVFNKNEGTSQTPTLTRPAANSHIALIYWKQRVSAAPWSDGADGPVFGVVYSDPAPIPVKPALTIEGAVEIGTVLIPSTATSTSSSNVIITTTVPYTSTTGGAIPFRTVADMRAWTSAADTQRAIVLGVSGTGTAEFVWSASTAGWVQSGALRATTAATRDTFWGTPATEAARLILQGCRTARADVGWTEEYFATYNATTNPAGARVPGWYPVSGAKCGGKVVASPGNKALSAAAWAATSVGAWSETADGAQRPNGIQSYISGATANAWVVPFDGRWEITAGIIMGTTGYGFISIKKNSTALDKNTGSIAQNAAGNSFSYCTPRLTTVVTLAAGDVLRFTYLVAAAATLEGATSCELEFGLTFVEPARG